MAHGGQRDGAGRKAGAINKATAAARDMAVATGVTPLEFMLTVMRDENAKREERLDMAKAAAPYVHARLSSIEAKIDAEVTSRPSVIEFVSAGAGED